MEQLRSGGKEVSTGPEMLEVAADYYESLFRDKRLKGEKADSLLEAVTARVSGDKKEELEADFMLEELEKAMRSL